MPGDVGGIEAFVLTQRDLVWPEAMVTAGAEGDQTRDGIAEGRPTSWIGWIRQDAYEPVLGKGTCGPPERPLRAEPLMRYHMVCMGTIEKVPRAR